MAPIPSYSQQDLELAVQAHQDGLYLQECQQMFDVPRDTIRRKVKEEFPTKQRPGVKPGLGAEEEECLGEREIEEVGNKTATKANETTKES